MKQILGLFVVSILLSTMSCHLGDDSSAIHRISSQNSIEEGTIKETNLDACSKNYSTKCLKASISKLLARLNKNSQLEIFPGISLAWSPIRAQKTPLDPNSTFENAFVGRISRYLSSISLKIKLIDAEAFSKSKSYTGVFGLDTAEGRKRKDNGAMWGMAMVMGGSMLSMALAGVAAAAAKALTMSIVAAALSALAALKGGDKSTTYEVISRPVLSHAHTYSSEVQHEHGQGHGHAHYKRSIDQRHMRKPLTMVFSDYNELRN